MIMNDIGNIDNAIKYNNNDNDKDSLLNKHPKFFAHKKGLTCAIQANTLWNMFYHAFCNTVVVRIEVLCWVTIRHREIPQPTHG